MLGQLQEGRECDAGYHDDERGGKARGEETQREQHQQCSRTDGERGRADVAEVARDLDQLRHRVRGRDVEPEDLAQLPDDEHCDDAVDVSDEDRARQVVGDPAQPEQPSERETCGDEQRQHGREARRFRGAGRGQAKQRRADQRRDRALGADYELARGAQQRVGDGREEQRIEAVHRGNAGDLRVRHR
jgi:hypothetical protein